MRKASPAPPPVTAARRVLVLQGGGALGSYQAGVYQALAERQMAPSWIAGVSIGAINGAIIAGNPPELRLERLTAFWEKVSSAVTPAPFWPGAEARTVFNEASAALVASLGAPGMFTPRLPPPWLATQGSPEAISWYDTAPLKETLEALVDFDRINGHDIRLSIGAVDIERGNLEVFDSARQKITADHVMASGALPPGFPPVTIKGRAYWDGGLVSNTPLQFVLDAEAQEDLLIFQVDLFSARGPMPRNLLEAAEREKDIRYSSRTRLNTDATLRVSRAKAAARAVLDSLPPDRADDPDVKFLREAAQENAVKMVQLIYRKQAYEGGSKDYEFSRQTMLEHWQAGLADAARALRREKDLLPSPAGASAVDPGLQGD